MRRAFAFLVVGLVAAPAHGQTPAFGNLGIDHFGLEDGLPGLYVSNLAVADNGLLWLNASGHLVSFDGFEFEDHDLDEFTGANPVLRGVGPGRADTVWVIVGQRLYSHARGERVRLRATFESRARSPWQDADGVIRAWDNLGAMRIGDDDVAREIRLGSELPSGLPVPVARTDLPANLWIHPMLPGGAQRINARQVLDPLPFPDAWPLPDPGQRTLLARVGRTTAVTRLDGSFVTNLPPEAGDWPLLEDRRGLVWTGRAGRVMAVGPSSGIVATLPLAPGDSAIGMAEDAEGNVWIATLRDGLYRIRPRPVSVVGADAGLTDGQVLTVSAGDRGSILAVAHGGRVTRVGADGVDTVYEPSAGTERALAALTDRRGTVWVSVSGDQQGLWGRMVDGTVIGIPESPFLMIEDPFEDGVLRGVGAGVLEIRPYAPGGPIVERHRPQRVGDTRDLLVDPEGAVWVVGSGGLARISDAGIEEFPADSFPLGSGRSIHRTADGSIWIGRYNGGIVRYRDGKFGVVRAADGLWDDGVSNILEDDAGNLWMGCNRGIHRVALRDLNAFLDGEIPRVRGRGYGPDAGFQNAETSGWHGYRSPDGRLWFPTFSGVAVIDPEEVLAREQAPPGIRIRHVLAGGATLLPDSVLALPRGQRRVDVAYGATLLSGQDGIRYEVRLEGVDSDWADAGRQRQVTYGSIPPGRHVFHARAISGAGVTSVDEATIALIVPPFFHETASFRLLVALLAALAVWALYHLRVRQMRVRAVRLRRLVAERTHELARSKEETEAALSTVEAQARELRSLDEAKSRFFANVSHELRTPLTLVQGPLQDVLDGRLGPTPDAVRGQVETVLASGRRLGELVEQLLDVARLESGELRMNLRRQDLMPLFDRLAQAFRALAKNRGIEFESELPDGSITALVDSDQMEKVYGNLLANAFKFTPEGGRVALTVETVVEGDNSDLVVTVEDDGPGIPEAEQQRIFDRFHQVDDSSKRTHGGAGLGLALVKEVAELHGGSVAVWSEPGKGSRFTVRVPMDGPTESASAPPAAATPAASPADIERDIETHLPATPGKAAAAAQAGAPDPAVVDSEDSERPTVLVVEDHPELRAYLRRHLEDRYRVIEAPSGGAGLDTARRAVPDMILCDVMMPGMDGEELCRAIRADPELAYLPVIMVTAKASRQSRLSALEGGADDYLVKPFDPQELRLRVGNALASRRRFAERMLAEGRALPFVPLELPGSRPDRDFATSLDAVLQERMGDEDFDVEDMARALAMSRATLYRKADEALGMSPMELLWTFRLKQAAHWLRETDGNVSEIAYASGFKTVPHFTRRFKGHFGTTPAAYRRREGRARP